MKQNPNTEKNEMNIEETEAQDPKKIKKNKNLRTMVYILQAKATWLILHVVPSIEQQI